MLMKRVVSGNEVAIAVGSFFLAVILDIGRSALGLDVTMGRGFIAFVMGAVLCATLLFQLTERAMSPALAILGFIPIIGTVTVIYLDFVVHSRDSESL